MKHQIFKAIIFFVVFFIVQQSFSTQCENCDKQQINPQMIELFKQAKMGDIILVDSPDLFSKAVAGIDNCHYSSSKVIYEANNVKYLIISDTGDLSYTYPGIEIAKWQEYLSDYKEVRIALFRPKNLTMAIKNEISRYVQMAQDARIGEIDIEYDLAFDNSKRDKLTCEKILLDIYGHDIVDHHNEDKWWIGTTLPCDLNLERFTQISQWVSRHVKD